MTNQRKVGVVKLKKKIAEKTLPFTLLYSEQAVFWTFMLISFVHSGQITQIILADRPY
jgi:hypothetical protein